MFSGDKKCLKKMSSLCYSFFLVLFSLFFAFSPLSVSALAPNAYQVFYNIYGQNNDAYVWTSELSDNDYFYLSNGKRYQWKINSLAYNGNYLSIHFETNIVYPDVGYQFGGFKNLDNLFVSYCGSGGTNGTIRSSAIRTAKTIWYSNNNTTENVTLTIYGDAVVSGLPYTSGTHDLYCGIATSDGNPFMYSINNGIPSQFYFEQSPTTVQFTNDISDALDSSRNNILNNIDNSINNVYNSQRAEEDAKGEELSDQADSLSLSATATANPFTSWFFSNPYGSNVCVNLPKFSELFNISPTASVCSPYPTTVRSILIVGSNMVIAALIIRLYYKKLKGGIDG